MYRLFDVRSYLMILPDYPTRLVVLLTHYSCVWSSCLLVKKKAGTCSYSYIIIRYAHVRVPLLYKY